MARIEIKKAVLDTAGNIQTGTAVTIKHVGTVTSATIYQAETGATTLSQPLSTDSNGYVPGWIEEGSYDVTVLGVTARMHFVAGDRKLGAMPAAAYPTTNPQSFHWDVRNRGWELGQGVASYDSFRVVQRQAGANMSVDIGVTAAGLMQAYVRGSTREGQGIYVVDNIDRSAPTAATYITQLNAVITAADGTNPRIDRIVLEMLDPFHDVAQTVFQARVRTIAGTPTGGATVDNLTGAAAVPANCLLLADVVVGNGVSSIVTANIRDRRPYSLPGTVPATLTAVDMVTFQPTPGLKFAVNSVATATSFDNHQGAALMFLPRRIVGATRIRWKYVQGATQASTNYIIGIYDATGRQIIATAATAFSGAGGATVEASIAITATTFDAGWYYVCIGLAAITASATVFTLGTELTSGSGVASTGSVGPITRNLGLRSTTGGTTLPTTLLAMTDVCTIAGALAEITVPIVALSVG